MHRYIGGFFEPESDSVLRSNASGGYHPNALALATGRSCLAFVLKVCDFRKVYVPYLGCKSLYSAFSDANVDVVFYSTNERLEPSNVPTLGGHDGFIYINYYGIKSEFSKQLQNKLCQSLILDNTHAFFSVTDIHCFAFTSARKYFGVPDGAYLYLHPDFEFERIASDIDGLQRFEDYSLLHLELRALGQQELAFKAFQEYEDSLTPEILAMSNFSRTRLEQIEYFKVSNLRRQNFWFLHERLCTENKLTPLISEIEGGGTVPFCYPLLCEHPFPREKLYCQNIFVPTLWPDVFERCSPDSFEYQFTRRLLPLPIDHRYGELEMEKIVSVILRHVVR